MTICMRLWMGVATSLLMGSIAASAQWLTYPTPGIPRTADGKANFSAPVPRSPDGHPELSGAWNKFSPKYRANIAADLKSEDIQPWARALSEQRVENLGKESMSAKCLPLGPAYTTDADSNGGGMMKIVQTPALMIILNPDLTYRQIFLDGRTHETAPSPSWMGYSVGHWEKDTLVVESYGFNDRTWLDTSGHPHSEALRVTERYRRPDFGHLELEMTLRDPAIYAKPWSVTVKADFAADTDLLEYVCNENDKGHEHWVGKDSDQKNSQLMVAPQILAKYAGTFIEQPKYWRAKPRTVEIVFTNGQLIGQINGGERTQQFARTETIFSGIGGLAFEFTKDGQGAVTGLFVKHVSGDYRFARQ